MIIRRQKIPRKVNHRAFLSDAVSVYNHNAKVGKIYAGGKAGAYTSGDTTITISNADNQNFKGANSVFTGKIYGYAGDKNSMTWGETDVIVDNYTGTYKGSFEYVDSVTVKGASDVLAQ